MIPFDTSDIKLIELYDCMQALSLNITVFGDTYQLAGYSLLPRNQFTCVIFWNGKVYCYNDLTDTDKLQLIFFKRNRLIGFQRSHVLYFVILMIIVML